VLGPERLPKVAREAALWLRKARSVINSAKADIKRELDLDELKELRALKASMQLPLNSHLAILEDAPVQAEPAEVQAELAPLSDGKADV
jgi:sec-independent protein translocase protein TatB